jgi:glycosyltransferase involved in cell wall biosynthesis
MHILIIPSWYPSQPEDAAGSFFRDQAIALRTNGCRVGVIYPALRTLRNWKSIFRGKKGIEFESDNGVDTVRFHGINWSSRLSKIRRRVWIRYGSMLFEKYVSEFGKPDLIHAHAILNAGLLAEKISSQYSIPFVITEHSSAYASNLISRAEISIVRRVAKKSSKNLAVSQPFADLLNKIASDSSQKWQVVPNIVSASFLDHSLPLQDESRDFVFINVAFMHERKNQRLILNAFANSFKGNNMVKCVMAGDGPDLSALKKYAAALDIADQVSFPGLLSRNEVVRQIASSNVFVLASNYETFGVVVIEAFALGRPVIATMCGGPDSTVNSSNGVLVPTNDVAALANAMQSIRENYKNFNAGDIRLECLNTYGSKAIAKDLISIYRDVMSKI